MTHDTPPLSNETVRTLNRIIDAHTQPGMWKGADALKAEIEAALYPSTDVDHESPSDLSLTPPARKAKRKRTK